MTHGQNIETGQERNNKKSPPHPKMHINSPT